jgi:hypothetical protein
MSRHLRPVSLLLHLSCALALAAGLSGAAQAAVKLPNGTTVPLTASLGNYLNGSANNDNINEGIDAVAEAAVEPQVFSPLCDFSGKYIAKGGDANFAIGWYNVDPARASNNPPRYRPVNTGDKLNVAAADSDIQILFPFASSLPAADQRDLKAAVIRNNPAYKGGLIGFALIPNPNGTGSGKANQYHYTEHRFNTQCTRCTPAGPWYSHLIYKSKKLENTFYLGFEDLDFLDDPVNGVNGNDLDYEDFLFRFTGISCLGAGEPCTIATNEGICQLGVKECDGQGNLGCKPLASPGQVAERCDGLDNNCNGVVDDGAPCPAGQICDRGRCTRFCVEELPCGGGLVCDRGRCVEPGCEGKTCPPNQVCRKGACKSPCEGITCPSPSICSGGLCVDPCAGVSCGAKKTCVNGACVASCECQPCTSGKACAAQSGQCVDPGCENMTCGAGDVCKAGRCVPACTGAVCPTGQRCEAGACADIPPDPVPDLGGGARDLAAPEEGGGSAAIGGCSCQVGQAGEAGAGATGISGLLLAVAVLCRRGRGRERR